MILSMIFSHSMQTYSLTTCLSSFLELFYIADNYFIGTLPVQMGNLSNLTQFLAQYNSLQGTIPQEFFQATSLQVLRLDNNQMTGPVASDIGNLSELRDLRLNNNSFTGTFPASIESANQLRKSQSRVSVVFWSTLSNNPTLLSTGFLLLANNTFEGDFPNVFGEFSSLEFFDIGNNQFTGPFPDTIFASPENLRIVYVRLNNFSGSLPPSFSGASNLRDFFINGNDFSGTLPSIPNGSLTQLNEFLLQDNVLIGSMPETICALRTTGKLEDLWVDCAPPAEIECNVPKCCTQCFPK